MKNSGLLLILIFITSISYSQKKYFRTSGESIFTFSEVTNNNQSIDSRMRFSFFFHLSEYFNYDFSNSIGIYTGLGIRNIGMITNENNSTIKRRSYNAGIPLAIKLGKLNNNSFVFAGGEYEYLFHYKEKTTNVKGKSVFRAWTSDATSTFLPSVFAGVQFKNGINLKFKYYLDNFLNTNYIEKVGNQAIKPFENIKSQLFYISISLNLNKYNFDKLKKIQPLKREPKTIEV